MSNAAVLGIGLAFLISLVFVGVYVLDIAAEESRHDITVENESFEPTGDAVETLENSNLSRADYDETVTVRNDTTDAIFQKSGNYTWNQANGTLTVTNNSQLANASTALITYGYLGQTLEQTKLTNIAFDANQWLNILVLIAAVALLLAGLGVMGGLA